MDTGEKCYSARIDGQDVLIRGRKAPDQHTLNMLGDLLTKIRTTTASQVRTSPPPQQSRAGALAKKRVTNTPRTRRLTNA